MGKLPQRLRETSQTSVKGGRKWLQITRDLNRDDLVSALLVMNLAECYFDSRERDGWMHPKGIEDVNDIRQQWQEIARTEVTRQRRNLGQLSEEQQMAVESVLVSVADHMFEIVVRGAEKCPGVDRFKYFNVWRRRAVAA